MAQKDETVKAIQNMQKAFQGAVAPLAKAVLHTGSQMAKILGDASQSAIDEWLKDRKKEADKKDPNPFKDEREI